MFVSWASLPEIRKLSKQAACNNFAQMPANEGSEGQHMCTHQRPSRVTTWFSFTFRIRMSQQHCSRDSLLVPLSPPNSQMSHKKLLGNLHESFSYGQGMRAPQTAAWKTCTFGGCGCQVHKKVSPLNQSAVGELYCLQVSLSLSCFNVRCRGVSVDVLL